MRKRERSSLFISLGWRLMSSNRNSSNITKAITVNNVIFEKYFFIMPDEYNRKSSAKMRVCFCTYFYKNTKAYRREENGQNQTSRLYAFAVQKTQWHKNWLTGCKRLYMKLIRSSILLLSAAILFILPSCSNMNKAQKGGAIGAGGGAVVGGVIGKISGNTALGAIIGAAVGGAAGTVIGKKMDQQADEIKNTVPSAKVERVGEGIEVEFSNAVLFGFNSADLNSAAFPTLQNLITVLNKYPDTNIEVQGHTDSTGTVEYNQSLSERRAQSVAKYLTAQGIASSRITTKGFGKSAPKYDNSTAEGRAQNRRVEFLITANDKMKKEAQQQSGQ